MRMAEPLADSWRSGGGKNLERQYAQMAAQIAAMQQQQG